MKDTIIVVLTFLVIIASATSVCAWVRANGTLGTPTVVEGEPIIITYPTPGGPGTSLITGE